MEEENEMKGSQKRKKENRGGFEKKEITDIKVQEIINNEFDTLEDWVDNQLDTIKNKCIDNYNNFHVEIPGEKKYGKGFKMKNDEDMTNNTTNKDDI